MQGDGEGEGEGGLDQISIEELVKESLEVCAFAVLVIYKLSDEY